MNLNAEQRTHEQAYALFEADWLSAVCQTGAAALRAPIQPPLYRYSAPMQPEHFSYVHFRFLHRNRYVYQHTRHHSLIHSGSELVNKQPLEDDLLLLQQDII